MVQPNSVNPTDCHRSATLDIKLSIIARSVTTPAEAQPSTCHPCRRRGVAKGGPVGPGTPNPIPLKLLRIKRVRSKHALRIRLIEL